MARNLMVAKVINFTPKYQVLNLVLHCKEELEAPFKQLNLDCLLVVLSAQHAQLLVTSLTNPFLGVFKTFTKHKATVKLKEINYVIRWTGFKVYSGLQSQKEEGKNYKLCEQSFTHTFTDEFPVYIKDMIISRAGRPLFRLVPYPVLFDEPSFPDVNGIQFET